MHAYDTSLESSFDYFLCLKNIFIVCIEDFGWSVLGLSRFWQLTNWVENFIPLLIFRFKLVHYRETLFIFTLKKTKVEYIMESGFPIWFRWILFLLLRGVFVLQKPSAERNSIIISIDNPWKRIRYVINYIDLNFSNSNDYKVTPLS